MNACSIAAVIVLTAASFSQGADFVGESVDVSSPSRVIVERGAHRRVWQRDDLIQLNDGRTINRPHRVIEYQTGLHFWDPANGEWRESTGEMAIVPDGATGVGHLGLHLAGNLNRAGAVSITLPENRGVLRMHVLGLAYTSPDAAQARWLAQIQDSAGILLGPHEVLFPNALAGEGGVLASVRYKYGRWGAEQDVLLGPGSRIPPPHSLGLNDETALLEIWSEIIAGPEPEKTPRVVDGLTDWTLDFGSARMTRGSAFALDAPLHRKSGVPVHKTLLTSDGRRFVIESVRYRSVRGELERLGALQAAAPDRRAEKNSRLALLDRSRAPEPAIETPVRMAANPKTFDIRNALVIDWVLYTGDSTNVVFPADSTALISGVCNFFGETVFEGSAVLKFTATNTAVIQCFSNVVFKSDHYRPVIFTSRQDRSVGADLYLAGAPTNYFQALACSEPDQEFKHLRISHADTGLHTYSMKLRHAQFVHCGFALYTEYTKWIGSGAEVDNVLFHDVVTAFGGAYFDTAARHVTVNRCGTLVSDWSGDPEFPSSVAFTNSLLAGITNASSVTFTTNYTVTQTTFVFNPRGSGIHYLPSSSTLHRSGTTNIPEWLAQDLRVRSTYAPTVISNVTLSTNIALVKQVPRGGPIPDIGYSYAPLDFVYGGNTLTNATLNLYAGTVLGIFTPGSNTHGLLLSAGANMVAEGAPREPVRIVRYNMAQEQANTNWASVYPGASVRTFIGTVSPSPTGKFSFTDWALSASDTDHWVGHGNSIGPFTFTHCTFGAGKITGFAPECRFTNCMFDRVTSFFAESDPITNAWQNCTFFGGSIMFNNASEGLWSIFNNVFYDTTDLGSATTLSSGYNAYRTNAATISGGANDIVTNIVFATGPLGRWYLPTNSPLLNRGSTNAGRLGLYFFTTAVDQRPETNSTVDLGYHASALASTNSDALPLDTDGDLVPNVIEDANGNGVQDAGETSVTRPDSPFVPRDYEPIGPSTRRTPLVISEIMYNPPGSQNNEFIELYNTHHLAQDLSGYSLRIGLFTGFTVSTNTILGPGNFLVIARDLNSYSQLTNAVGPYTVNLPNSSGQIQLLNAQGAVLLDVEYSDKHPWPVAPDGAGHSLVLARASYGEDDSRAWAASEQIGGSPGYGETNRVDRLRAIQINEFYATNSSSGQNNYVELFNRSNEPIDILGCLISDRTSDLRRFTNTTINVIAPGGFALFSGGSGLGQFPFDLHPGGDEKLFLTHPDGTRVLDGVYYEGQSNLISMGRSPDGAFGFTALASRSPAATNSAALGSPVVISEIMFNSVSGNDDHEFVELRNITEQAVNIGGWQLNGVGDFPIPANTTVPASGHVVVARSNSVLMALYPGNTNSVGDYAPSRLSNRGQKLRITRPRTGSATRVIMNEITYQDGGRWGQWTDGGGASLELIDVRGDNRLAANWADSAEIAHTNWTRIEHTGKLELGDCSGLINALEIILLEAGECLVDNVTVLIGGTTNNLVFRGDLESGTSATILMGDQAGYSCGSGVTTTNGTNQVVTSTNLAYASTLAPGWYFEGDHDLSEIEASGGIGNSGCLRLRATGRGDYAGNRVFTVWSTNQAVLTGTVCTIRADVKWLRGFPEVVLRMRGNHLEASGAAVLPSNIGTPGMTNSRAIPNAPPAIFEVTHSPALPNSGEPVVISARVHDPDGVTNVALRYRVDPNFGLTTLAMRDDGTGGDGIARDGLYSATLAGQSANTLIAFRVEATDGLDLTNRFPAEQVMYPGDTERRECLVRFGESVPSGSFGTYRIWMTSNTLGNWTFRSRIHNSPLDVTFAYGTHRVVYNAGARYSGTIYTSGLYTTPTGAKCGYAMDFPSDDRFMGITGLAADYNSADAAEQAEQVFYWMANALGLPFNHRRYIHLYVNGVKRTSVYEDAQQPNSDYLEQWQPDDADGDLFKLSMWWQRSVFPLSPGAFTRVHGSLVKVLRNVPGGGQVLDVPRYRWTWQPRAMRSAANDFSNLSNLLHAVENPGDSAYTTNVESLVDIEQWMRVFALERIARNWDSFGIANGHNMYAYKPLNGRWQLHISDVDYAFVASGAPATNELFETFSDQAKEQGLLEHPPFRRAFWRAVQDAVNGPMLGTKVDPVFDGNYSALQANSLSASNPASHKTWVVERRNYLSNLLISVACGFAITNNGGNNFTTNASTVTLAGRAPPHVKFLALNSTLTNVTWTTVTNWSLSVTLSNGANSFSVQGYDRFTNSISGTNASITITRP